MKLLTLGVVLGTTLALAADASAQAEEECHDALVWHGAMAGGVQAAVAGDRILVRSYGRLQIVGRDGAVLLDREDSLDAFYDQLIGGDASFFRVASDGAVVSVARIAPDGTTSPTPLVLNQYAPDVMNPAQAAHAPGVLAVAWAVPQGLYASARDLHVALLNEDGSLLAQDVIVGRAGAYSATPAAQGDVIGVLWREDPYLQLKGVRFSTVDGHRLDPEPIAIARDFNGFQVARAGAALRLYADSPYGTISMFDLDADGTVTPRGRFTDALGRQVLGLASGDVLHVSPPEWTQDLFPRSGAMTVTRETAAGLVPFATFDGIEGVAVAVGDDVVLVSAHDTVAGNDGASILELRRLSATGTVLATAELIHNPLAQGVEEVCDYPDYGDGCSAAGTPARAALPLMAALLLVVRRRRRRVQGVGAQA